MAKESKPKESKLNLYQKINKVMEATEYLQKDGTNSFQKYKYLSDEKITGSINTAMREVGLVIVPLKCVMGETVEGKSKSGTNYLTTVNMVYRLINSDDPPEFIDLEMSGQGIDSGDKGLYKALTGAYKYLMRQTFVISTGDDAEKESPERGTKENFQKKLDTNKPRAWTMEEIKKEITVELQAEFSARKTDKFEILRLFNEHAGDQTKIMLELRKSSTGQMVKPDDKTAFCKYADSGFRYGTEKKPVALIYNDAKKNWHAWTLTSKGETDSIVPMMYRPSKEELVKLLKDAPGITQIGTGA